MIKKNFTEERVLMWVPPSDKRNYLQASDAEVREILMPSWARELADVCAALDDADVPKNDSSGNPVTLAERVMSMAELIKCIPVHCESVQQGHRELDAAGVPTQLNGKALSLEDRIAWLTSKR